MLSDATMLLKMLFPTNHLRAISQNLIPMAITLTPRLVVHQKHKKVFKESKHAINASKHSYISPILFTFIPSNSYPTMHMYGHPEEPMNSINHEHNKVPPLASKLSLDGVFAKGMVIPRPPPIGTTEIFP